VKLDSLAVACLDILASNVRMKSMAAILILVEIKAPVQEQVVEDSLAIVYLDTLVHSVTMNRLISVIQVHVKMEVGARIKMEAMYVCVNQDIQVYINSLISK
jgi:cytochrome b subunit of formate dehydrogenase